MSDIAILEIRLVNAEDGVREVKGAVSALEETHDEVVRAIGKITQWKDGNGARGAEARLQAVETDMTAVKACVERAIAPENISHIAREAAKAVVTNARDKDKTTVAKIRAVGPMFTGVAALLTGLAALIALLVK